MDKLKKDIVVEIRKLGNLAKDKLEKDGGFNPFVVSYSIENGNKFTEIERWENDDERSKLLTDVTKWLKTEATYGFVLGSITTRREYKNREDFDKDQNYTEVPGIILVGKTPDKSYHLTLKVEKVDGKWTVTGEQFSDVTNDNSPTFLDEVFKGVN